MTRIPVYRPRVTVYHRGPDGEWDSTYGTVVAPRFAPLEDSDGSTPTECGFRRVVDGGVEVVETILAPTGFALVERGAATLLRPPTGHDLTATSALAMALRVEAGLSLDRPFVAAIPLPPRPTGPVVAAGFDWGDPPAPAKRKGALA